MHNTETVAMEMQQHNTETVAMEMQQQVLFTLLLS
jgi:hypothetical protein